LDESQDPTPLTTGTTNGAKSRLFNLFSSNASVLLFPPPHHCAKTTAFEISLDMVDNMSK
jgi:hypothetical protein